MTNERGRDAKAGHEPGAGERSDAARAATLRVIEQHGAQVMRTARRYAATPEDAEDAYQRAVEIMLTKAPDIPDGELLPWLKTVVRHEAFAIRRQRDRFALGSEDSFDGEWDGEVRVASAAPSPSEQAERFERLRLGAEALGQLKPQEARAMTLLAQGYSYKQICDKTGWTYTKVNRCLAEGRESFSRRVSSIESGAECERLRPKLSAFADGEAGPADIALLRRHLRGCLGCRATLREQALAPAVVGALVPSSMLGRLWPGERGAELVSTLKAKLSSLFRFPGLDAGSDAGQLAVEGGSRGLATIGAAKGLMLICLGGVGAGGAACIAHGLGGQETGSARAATNDRGSLSEAGPAAPRSPDRNLVLERLRPGGEAGEKGPSRRAGGGSPRGGPTADEREAVHSDRDGDTRSLEPTVGSGGRSAGLAPGDSPTTSGSATPSGEGSGGGGTGERSSEAPTSDPYTGYEGGRDPYSGYPDSDPYSGYQSRDPYSGYQGSDPYSGYQGRDPYSGYERQDPYSGYEGAQAPNSATEEAQDPYSGYDGP